MVGSAREFLEFLEERDYRQGQSTICQDALSKELQVPVDLVGIWIEGLLEEGLVAASDNPTDRHNRFSGVGISDKGMKHLRESQARI
ncbi:MAG: hypothetical protein ACOX6K_10860 [Sphaerochaetaceae bacterium]|jgi:hypothetical protein